MPQSHSSGHAVAPAVVDPGLVVTDMTMRNGHGATLMRRLRQGGSRARFLGTTSWRPPRKPGRTRWSMPRRGT